MDDAGYFGGKSSDLTKRIVIGYYYGLSGNDLNLFLRDMDLEHLIQDDNMIKNIISELFGTGELSGDYLNLLKNYQMTKEDGQITTLKLKHLD